jgi:hypothetical protein
VLCCVVAVVVFKEQEAMTDDDGAQVVVRYGRGRWLQLWRAKRVSIGAKTSSRRGRRSTIEVCRFLVPPESVSRQSSFTIF